MPKRAPALTSPERRVAVFKALGDPTRLRIVDFLRKHGGEATGTQVAQRAGISLALLCHHADALVDSGIVQKRKEGQTSFWKLDRDAMAGVVRNLGAG
jgi:DNA-binding transcriptional ArsR family regulator